MKKAELSDEVIVQKIQKDLAEVGITVALEPLDNKVELTKERAGELAFIPKSWEPDWPDVGSVLIAFQPGGSFAKRMHWEADADKWGIRDLIAKGLGEPVTIPTAAAVANAVYDATGIRVTTTPINPIKLTQLLSRRGKEG